MTAGFSRQPLVNREGLLIAGQRLRRPAGVTLQDRDVLVTRGEVRLELGDCGVFAPAARTSCGPAHTEASASAGRPVSLRRLPMLLWVAPGRSGTG